MKNIPTVKIANAIADAIIDICGVDKAFGPGFVNAITNCNSNKPIVFAGTKLYGIFHHQEDSFVVTSHKYCDTDTLVTINERLAEIYNEHISSFYF